jgi:hypothetical protein
MLESRDVVNIHKKSGASIEVAGLPASRIWYSESLRVIAFSEAISSSQGSSQP